MTKFWVLLSMGLAYVFFMLFSALNVAHGCEYKESVRYQDTEDQLQIAHKLIDFNCDGVWDKYEKWVIDEDGTFKLEYTSILVDPVHDDATFPVGVAPYYVKYDIQEG